MRPSIRACLLPALLLLAAGNTHARQGEPPYSLSAHAKIAISVPIIDVHAIDAAQRRAEVAAREHTPGPHSKRLNIADDNRVSITPDSAGVWQLLADGARLWRVRVRASGATDMHLGFTRFALPAGATLHVIGANDYYQGPYVATDATAGRFTAAVVPGDTATVELRLPAGSELAPGALELGSVGAGFRALFDAAPKSAGDPGSAGACNIDVACPLGQAYPDEIRAVGYYEFFDEDEGEYYACSGTLVADVPRDRRNYFLSAAHCISTASEAASMVVYWNYQSTHCGVLSAPPGGFFNDDQHGATLRAQRADVDFSLVELTQTPLTAWNVYYAGWDASAVTPAGTIGIHHASADVKKITAGPAPTTTSSCIGSSTGATHWWTGPYTQGTTEVGSSGSGLFTLAGNNSHAHLLIGTLSGGDAACSDTTPTRPNFGNDCYGRLSVAWNGPDAASRLRDWLDPSGTGTTVQAGIDNPAAAPAINPWQHSTRAIPVILQHPRLRR